MVVTPTYGAMLPLHMLPLHMVLCYPYIWCCVTPTYGAILPLHMVLCYPCGINSAGLCVPILHSMLGIYEAPMERASCCWHVWVGGWVGGGGRVMHRFMCCQVTFSRGNAMWLV